MGAFKMSKGALGARVSAMPHGLTATEGGSRAQALANAVVPQRDVAGYAKELTKLWIEAQEKFLVMGRYLILAKETLPYGEFEEMVRNHLPFGRSVAHKLRAVAAAVDEGRLAFETLPRTYMTAYALTVLDDSELQTAQERGLVRQDVLLREVEAFKREIRAPVGLHRREALRRERMRIKAEISRLSERLEAVEDELDGDARTIETTIAQDNS